jgi:hypothetical protein
VRDLDLAALGAGRSVGLEPEADPVLAVCTHGRHDACCAELGRPVALALASGPQGAAVWETSHVGGDRFAGNLVVLPRGLYYGGLDPQSAEAVAAATGRGEVLLEHLRGRSDLPMPAQAADVDVRRRLGLTGFDEVHVVSARTTGDVTTVALEAAGEPLEVRVRRVLGDEQVLTCRAGRANPVTSYEVEPVA